MNTPKAPPNPLLDGPILRTLLRLALPSVLAMLMQVLVGIAETRYIGLLGTTPLAAMALVFPFAMLTQMMSNGAMGGGVSSAVSRALGAGNPERARVLAYHALIIGLIAGLIYTLVFLALGPTFYRWLGGRGDVLAQAIDYAAILFCGSVMIWVGNALASVLRGTGNVRVPSVTVLATSVLQIVLGGTLGLGLGPIPSFGMAGVACGQLAANTLLAVVLWWYLASGRARIRLGLERLPLQREMFHDILKVGALACLSPVQSVLTILILTGLVGHLGLAPLAGYGIGQRLEFLLIPIAFGIGVASVPMVGMAIGAGRVERARRVAWTAGTVSAFNLGVLGLLVFLFPDLWSAIFSRDPEVLDYARQYLRWAGLAFPFFGMGLTVYFASQGSGKVLGPVLASTLRLVVVAAAGAWLATHDGQAWQYFALVAVAMITYGLGTVAAVRLTRWGRAG